MVLGPVAAAPAVAVAAGPAVGGGAGGVAAGVAAVVFAVAGVGGAAAGAAVVVLLLGQVVWQVLLHQMLVLLVQLAKLLLPLLVLLVLWAVVLLLLLAVLAQALPLELWTWVLWVALPLEHGGVPPTHFLLATQGSCGCGATGKLKPWTSGIALACGAVAVEVGTPSCLPYMAFLLLLLLLLPLVDWEAQSDWNCHCCTGHAGPPAYRLCTNSSGSTSMAALWQCSGCCWHCCC